MKGAGRESEGRRERGREGEEGKVGAPCVSLKFSCKKITLAKNCSSDCDIKMYTCHCGDIAMDVTSVCVCVCVWQLKAPAAHAREPSCFLVYIYLSAQCATRPTDYECHIIGDRLATAERPRRRSWS